MVRSGGKENQPKGWTGKRSPNCEDVEGLGMEFEGERKEKWDRI